jgi:hypothetical protein
MRVCLGVSVCTLALLTACDTLFSQPTGVTLGNPYENVDWRTFSQLSYVRAEVVRHADDGPIRLLVDPFALTRR